MKRRIQNNPATTLARTLMLGMGILLSGNVLARGPVTYATTGDLAAEATARENADTALQGKIDPLTNYIAGLTHVIGETYAGGKVFYVDDSGQHGLIAALADQGAGSPWYNGTFRMTGTTGDGLNAGAMNTAMIIATQMNDNPAGNFAAKVAADYSVQEDGVTPCTGSAAEICYGDWYLPSKAELNLLYQQKDVVGDFASGAYWSSTEYDSGNAWGQYFYDGSQNTSGKLYGLRVRAVRAF